MTVQEQGFNVSRNKLNPMLYDFQKDIVQWALRLGKAAVFADCGLGKTPIQLEWANQLKITTLIFAPLAVSRQTKREGKKFHIKVNIAESQNDIIENQINITNYEKLHKFNMDSFDAIVLDESSILKSYSGKFRNEIIEKTKNIKYKLACTATPAPNDYMELGNHSEFLNVNSRVEMLSTFFIHDGSDTAKWRLKKHAEKDYWQWLTEWAVMIRKPSDLGYKDGKFRLPKLKVKEHIIKCSKPKRGQLFVEQARGLQKRQKARKNSLKERCQFAQELIGKSQEHWLIWCNLNDESTELKNVISDSHEVRGSNKDEYKEQTMLDFANSKVKRLVTKPSIAGFGMNWQHCHNMIFVGLSDSYEQYYQAMRRCWRFGQEKEVKVHIVLSDTEGSVLKNIQRKESEAENMAKEMVDNMKDLTKQKLKKHSNKKEIYYEDVVKEKNYKLYQGDCVEVTKQIKSESVDYSIFSPPFAELYCYSDSTRDMGNSKNYKEFFKHFEFLIPELLRITKKGRLLSFHCMDIPSMKERDGVIGLKDFPGDVLRAFQKHGWIYHSRVVIWKNPLIEATRTKSVGLLHKQLCKDSSMSRQGCPDYIITLRKKGGNKEFISHNEGFTEFIGENELKEEGIKYSHEVWRRYASPVWMDINQTRTLNYRIAKGEKDEKHICPLQLDTIERCIELWSNKGDIVFSPFAGIGSEGFVSLEKKRKFIGIELKSNYFDQAKKNLKRAERNKTKTLF